MTDGQRGMVLGMGCRRNSMPEEALRLAEQVLASTGLPVSCLRAVATMDGRDGEPALQAVSAHFGVPLLAFSAEALERETPRLATPSDIVFRETGCHGVAEAAALAAAGGRSHLLIAKRIGGGVTAAVAVVHEPGTD